MRDGKQGRASISQNILTGKRPRIQDVAAIAGVSLGTVSAVLNANGRIGAVTRERVQNAIRELGYRPDHYASNLARKQSQLLGVVVSNLQNPFFSETAQAMEEEAAKFGFQTTLMTTNFQPEQLREAVKRLLSSRLAGLAVLTSEEDEPSRQLVLASGLPAVFLDVGEPGKKLSILQVDSLGGMRQAVSHLIALGHRQFLFVKNSQAHAEVHLLSHQLRDQGFAAAIQAFNGQGLRTRTIDIKGPAAEAGYRAVIDAYDPETYSAVICITDMVAMGVCHGLRSRGLRVPEDVSVVGFDNAFFSAFLSPPLTTVDVARGTLSRIAVEALIGRTPGKLLRIETELIVRSSTGKLNEKAGNINVSAVL